MQSLSDKGHPCTHHVLKVCTIFKPTLLNQLKFPLKIEGKIRQLLFGFQSELLCRTAVVCYALEGHF